MNDELRMKDGDLRRRTKEFALKIIKLCLKLPKHPQVQVIAKQLLRSGTSVGANYREAYRARSQSEFISKMGVCLQELEETGYWLELLEEARLYHGEELERIKNETEELTKIFVTCIKTSKTKKNS